MSTNKIITISRQLGSGGSDVGKLLAKRLDIPFYDKELLTLAAKQSGLSQSAFEDADEQPTNSFLYSLSINANLMAGGYNSYSKVLSNDQLFLFQSGAIRKIADEGPCVMVGRCADYILEEYKNLVSIFLYADLDLRIKRIMEKDNLTESKAKNYITKTDKKRGNYYNFYSGKNWAEASSYHLSIDSLKLGIEKTADLIEKYIQLI